MKKSFLVLLLITVSVFIQPTVSHAAIQQDTDGYYMIAASSDLKEFTELVNSGYLIANAKLMNDIVLSGDQGHCDWTEVGQIGPNNSREYLGTLDGKGYAINGLYINGSGLVGFLGTTGVIKNLTITGHIQSTKSSTGAFAGTCKGKIMNCVNKADITTTSSIVGGIAGSTEAQEEKTVVIINCFNSGKISADGGAIGGIIGSLSPNCGMENCVNIGDVSSMSSSGIAGIVGNANDKSFVFNCVNTGTVNSSTSSKWGGASNVGGVTGSLGGEIKNCVSTGNVIAAPHPDDTSNNTGNYIGGIVGRSNSAAVITNCHWFKGAAISPNHGVGGDGSYDVGTDEGTTAADAVNKLPVGAIILDSYEKEGYSFELTATAYPTESEQAKSLALAASEGLTLTPAALKNSEKATVTTVGTAGTEYEAKIAPEAADSFSTVSFKVTPADAPAAEPDKHGGSSGCNGGFAALLLLAAVPFAFKKGK